MDEPPGTAAIVELRPAARRQRLVVLSDGRELVFSDEACERAGVRVGDEASPAVLAGLEEAEQRVVAHNVALRLLSTRARSDREMRTRLAMRGVGPAAVEAEITRLQDAGLLDDASFARAWVEDRKRHSPRGRRMLRYELLGRGIDSEAIDEATGGVDDRETALALARKKSRAGSGESYEDFIARVGGFLRRRGFDYAVASEAARGAWQESQGVGAE